MGDPVVSVWQGHLTLKQVLQGQAGREGEGDGEGESEGEDEGE